MYIIKLVILELDLNRQNMYTKITICLNLFKHLYILSDIYFKIILYL